MILVGQYDSPFVRRVAVTLNLYHLPFTRNTISVFSDAVQMQRINPLVRIPSLVLDDGETLWESDFILDHLDEKVGANRALVPRDGEMRRHILNTTALAKGCVEKAGGVVYERHYHTQAHRSAEWEQRCLSQLQGGLAELEKRATSRWFHGEHITHADVMTGCMLGYLALRLPESFPEGKFPKLHALAERCELNAAFAGARIGANETMPQQQA
jgi:glutathione S-transferase